MQWISYSRLYTRASAYECPGPNDLGLWQNMLERAFMPDHSDVPDEAPETTCRGTVLGQG